MILGIEESMVNRHSLFSLELPGSSIRTSTNRQTDRHSNNRERERDKETRAMKKTKSK